MRQILIWPCAYDIKKIMNTAINPFLIVSNVFNEVERNSLTRYLSDYDWFLDNYSISADDESTPRFWARRPRNDHAEFICGEFFKSKIEASIKLKIEILKIHINGQTHGQSGKWHRDASFDSPDVEHTYTLVYFPKKWLPEYGGHLLIKLDGEVYSILPEFNKGVIFRRTTEHIGLEPTVHCKHMRESIACNFKVII